MTPPAPSSQPVAHVPLAPREGKDLPVVKAFHVDRDPSPFGLVAEVAGPSRAQGPDTTVVARAAGAGPSRGVGSVTRTPVSLHLDDVEVRKALEMLSREGSENLLVSPGVRGRITADLRGMSPEEAFQSILKLGNLVAYRERGILFVCTPEEHAQASRTLRVFPLDHVAASDVEPAVRGLLSPAGKCYITQSDPEDNRRTRDVLVVDDGPDHLRRVEQYLRQIDQPPLQVLIEAHILQVDLKDETRSGVNWDHIFRVVNNDVTLKVQGFANPAAPQAFFVNINGSNFHALIECLQTTTDAKTLASPKVLVLNGQKAQIQIGERLGYRVVTTTETSSMEDVKFLEVGVVLEVTPRISRDGHVTLRVKPKVSSGKINTETALPEEKTTQAETDVMMNDCQGMLIGGLIQEKDDAQQSKIPFLGDLWLVGRLFQKQAVTKSRAEIIITLLPRVMPYAPDYAAQERCEVERAETPLFHGALERCARPGEPMLPDAVRNPRGLLPVHWGHQPGNAESACPPQNHAPEEPEIAPSAPFPPGSAHTLPMEGDSANPSTGRSSNEDSTPAIPYPH
ncbi:MAG: hypothetical protein NUV77_09600 [Thermoguttaceae bacterium]|nr:hypothetical protein [Thermoguttaceae bacterium]